MLEVVTKEGKHLVPKLIVMNMRYKHIINYHKIFVMEISLHNL